MTVLGFPLPNFVQDRSCFFRLSGVARPEHIEDALTQNIGGVPAIDALGTLIPIKYLVVKVANENRVLSLVQKRCLLPDALLRKLSFGDLKTNSNILKGLLVFVQKRDDRSIDPIDRSILCFVTKFALPDIAIGNGRPYTSDEFFRVKTGVNDSLILA